VAIALVVGTILFCINRLDVVLQGEADALVWIESAVTYVVPFCVSCAGVLAATRRPPDEHGQARESHRVGDDVWSNYLATCSIAVGRKSTWPLGSRRTGWPSQTRPGSPSARRAPTRWSPCGHSSISEIPW
jgi:hypothetical protein